jgi:hypothetical protein
MHLNKRSHEQLMSENARLGTVAVGTDRERFWLSEKKKSDVRAAMTSRCQEDRVSVEDNRRQ